MHIDVSRLFVVLAFHFIAPAWATENKYSDSHDDQLSANRIPESAFLGERSPIETTVDKLDEASPNFRIERIQEADDETTINSPKFRNEFSDSLKAARTNSSGHPALKKMLDVMDRRARGSLTKPPIFATRISWLALGQSS